MIEINLNFVLFEELQENPEHHGLVTRIVGIPPKQNPAGAPRRRRRSRPPQLVHRSGHSNAFLSRVSLVLSQFPALAGCQPRPRKTLPAVTPVSLPRSYSIWPLTMV